MLMSRLLRLCPLCEPIALAFLLRKFALGLIVGSRRKGMALRYPKHAVPQDQMDRPRGGPVIAGVSRFVKPELLAPQASRFEATPDSFRTNQQRSKYGPKRGAGGELSRTEGESKLKRAVEKSGRPVMREAAKITAAEERGESAAQERAEEEC